jgi:hypothetical protein
MSSDLFARGSLIRRGYLLIYTIMRIEFKIEGVTADLVQIGSTFTDETEGLAVVRSVQAQLKLAEEELISRLNRQRRVVPGPGHC